MDTSHLYDVVTRRGFLTGSGPPGPVERSAPPPRLGAASNCRRIYRAYQQLQRARLDGDYQRIIKWKTRVDELLDNACKPSS